ncbi:MAG TPA: Hsp20/alpha crystallin family protein [Caulobacterales bacterium]|nr:Hsp20/alpha crystallin family protein [Caulobacterales bacterium]
MREVATTNGGSIAPFSTLRREMDRLFEDFGTRFMDVGAFTNGRFLPDIDYAETDKDIVVTTELAGVDPKDVEIALTNDVLTIRGEKKSQRDEKKEHYQYAERSYGSFERAISVPPGIDAAKVDAKFDKGVLKVTLPKPAELQSKRQKIEIKSAS